MRTLRVLFLVLIPGIASATPSITAISGSSGTLNQLIISGSGFGTKGHSTAMLYADGQSGALAPVASLSQNPAFLNLNQNGGTQFITPINDTNNRWGTGAFRTNWDYTANSRVAAFELPNYSSTYSSKMLFSFWVKTDINFFTNTGGTTQNWKFSMRIWNGSPGGVSSYPDIIINNVAIGEAVGDIRTTMEDWNLTTIRSPVTQGDRIYSGASIGFPNTTWRRETYLIQLNSAQGVPDGTLLGYINASKAINIVGDATDGWRYNSGSSQSVSRAGFINNPYIQMGIANALVPIGTNAWYSDIFEDDSWNRVEIGNASTYAACTQLEIQPYTAWADGSVTISQRLGTLSSSKYIYVCDNSNNCNASGFLLSSQGNPPPSVSSLSPGNGPASGGTTVTASGANYVATPTVKVGGVSATSVNFVSSSQITFATPAGSAGTTQPVVVTNPDNQNASFSGFQYDSPINVQTATGVLPWCKPF